MQDKTIEIEKVRDKAVKEEALKKKLYVVGIGPGAYEQITIRASQVLEECSVIAGYTVYIDLIKEHFPGREFLTTPMRQEKKRHQGER